MTTSGLAVPWNASHRIAVGYAPIRAEYAFCPPGSMEPGPWPCMFQHQGSRFESEAAREPLETERGNVRGGGVPITRSAEPGASRARGLRRSIAGSPRFPIGETFEIEVVFATTMAGRKIGFVLVRMPQK